MVAKIPYDRRNPLLEKCLNSETNSRPATAHGYKWLWGRSKTGKNFLKPVDFNNLVIVRLVPGATLNSLLSQVCGGPLEAVAEADFQSEPIALLEYVNRRHAQRFKQYVRSGRCTLNGIRVSLVEQQREELTDLVREVFNRQPLRPVGCPEKARRTLHVFRPLSPPFVGSNAFLENQRSRLARSHLDMGVVMTNFKKVGRVLQVRPMLARACVAFAIDYDCIASAYNAKTCFDEERDTYMGNQPQYRHSPRFSGLEDWSLEYLPDSTEFACYLG